VLAGRTFACLQAYRFYGGVTAVDGVTLTVDEGEIVGLIGRNGAGKSSLIDALTGYHPAAGGRVTFPGLGDVAAPLEVLPGRPAAQLDHRVAVDPPRAAFVDRHQFHITKSTITASRVERA
jgi:ATPase subunit of ABC transporter with duplicated ATPase domains